MLAIRLDSAVPLVDQIIVGLRTAIATGDVGVGDELPPVRQLAADLGINLNTVARAYRALEGLGLLRAARGRGTVVVAARETRAETARERTRRLTDGIRAALADARLAGLDRPAVEGILDSQMEAIFDRGRKP